MTVQNPTSEEKSFLASLFDWSFESFVALRFIKVIYAVSVIGLGLVAAILFLFALGGGQVGVAVFVLVGFFVYLVLIRIYLEVIALLFRIGENTTVIREAMTSGDGTP